MPQTIFDSAARQQLLARIDRLTPDAHGAWGKLTAPKMVSHLHDSLRMALGDLVVPPRKSFLGNRLMRYLVIHVMPWPKGAPTAPQLLARAPESWPADIASLKGLVERAAANESAGAWQPHPAFGDISTRTWGVLIHRHVAHHLTQFGV
jgi:hypothetical protein